MEINKIYNEDCLEGMKGIADGSVDMVLCDLPFGTTQCKWDTIIPFEPLWEQYKRVIKPNGAIVLTASQPFTSALVMSNPKMFKYDWCWKKPKGTGHLNAKRQPMRDKEDICVFYASQCTYNPQMTSGKPYKNKAGKNPHTHNSMSDCYGAYKDFRYDNNGKRYPKQVIEFGIVERCTLHPTQKPVALYEYLIRTYTNPGELVLDNCMGSGTTAIACMNTGRNFIGFEMDKGYYDIACKRIEYHKDKVKDGDEK